MGDIANEVEDKKTEDKWEREDDVRALRKYFELRSNPDRYSAAIEVIKKEENIVSEELRKESEYKEKIGFAKR